VPVKNSHSRLERDLFEPRRPRSTRSARRFHLGSVRQPANGGRECDGHPHQKYTRRYSDATNERSPQRIEGVSGSVEQSIRIAKGGKNIHSGQYVSGSDLQSLSSDGSVSIGGIAPAGDDERVHIRCLIRNNTRRLRKLEAQAATKGGNTPPEVTIEIEDLRTKIERLRKQVRERQG